MFKYIWIVTIFSFSSAFGQQKATSGLVVDELGMMLSNVRIKVQGDRHVYFSDCDGAYKLKASIGDTLVFSKKGFFTTRKVISQFKKNKTMVGFDYPSMIATMDKDPHWIKFKTVRNAQPLIVVDHLPFKQPTTLEPDTILSTRTVMGQVAEDYFGPYAWKGVILIFTKCK